MANGSVRLVNVGVEDAICESDGRRAVWVLRRELNSNSP